PFGSQELDALGQTPRMLNNGDVVAEPTGGRIVGVPARQYDASFFRAELSEAPVETSLAQCLGGLGTAGHAGRCGRPQAKIGGSGQQADRHGKGLPDRDPRDGPWCGDRIVSPRQAEPVRNQRGAIMASAIRSESMPGLPQSCWCTTATGLTSLGLDLVRPDDQV